jgi:hypothetical protein
MRNEITYDNFLDIQKWAQEKARTDSGSAFESAIMLIKVYFAKLKLKLDGYENARERVNKILPPTNTPTKGETLTAHVGSNRLIGH